MLVKGAAELLTDLAAAVAQIGGSHRLARDVAAIQRRVTANHTHHACLSLHAFISDVRTKIGKKLSRTQAASLIQQARDIQAALGCQQPRHRW